MCTNREELLASHNPPTTQTLHNPLPSCPARQVFLTHSHLVLAMEYAEGGDLLRYVAARRGLTEGEARWFFQQLMIGVDFCHRMVGRVGDGGADSWLGSSRWAQGVRRVSGQPGTTM